MKADKRRARFGGRNDGPGWWHVWQYQRPLALKQRWNGWKVPKKRALHRGPGHAETPKTGPRNAEQPAPLAESTPTSARSSAPRKITLDEALAKLADDSCGCGLCDLIATTMTNLERTTR